MSGLLIAFALIFAVGVAIGAYAIFAPKKQPATQTIPPSTVAPASVPEVAPSDWTRDAEAEFDALSEAARCDFIFAVGALDDARSRNLLFHALDDRSPTVALAAAHVLARAGSLDEVRAYVAAHQRERSEELMQLLSMMA